MRKNLTSSYIIEIIGIIIFIVAFIFYPLLDVLDRSHLLPDWIYSGLSYLWDYGTILIALAILWKMEPKTIWHLTNPKKNTLLFGGHFILLFLWAIVSMNFLPAPVNGNEVGQMLEDAISTSNQWVFMVTVILIGPIREELIFRGQLFAHLKRWQNNLLSMLISASLFSLSHLPFSNLRVTDFLFYFMSGLVFAHFYQKTRSISWVILLHIAWNGFVYYMSTR